MDKHITTGKHINITIGKYTTVDSRRESYFLYW